MSHHLDILSFDGGEGYWLDGHRLYANQVTYDNGTATVELPCTSLTRQHISGDPRAAIEDIEGLDASRDLA